MIDFSLSEEQKSLLQKARDFATEEIKPVAIEFDKEGTYPEEILKKAHKLGLMYTNIPKEYGGSGFSYLEHYIITEALNYECPSIAQMIGISHLSMAPIQIGGTEEQKKEFIGTINSNRILH